MLSSYKHSLKPSRKSSIKTSLKDSMKGSLENPEKSVMLVSSNFDGETKERKRAHRDNGLSLLSRCFFLHNDEPRTRKAASLM